MALSREDILLDSIKEALSLYQRSLIWAITAALSGALITFTLQNPDAPAVPVLSGTLSAPLAWGIAQVLYVVFGALAFSALRRYRLALESLAPAPAIRSAIQFYPSLATLPGRFFRLGSVLLPLLVTWSSWSVEIVRERHGGGFPREMSWWFGLLLVFAILLFPYAGILRELRDIRLAVSPASKAEPEPAGLY